VRDHWSDADVYRVLDHPDGDAYLKVSRHDARYPAKDEFLRLEWVAGRAPCPRWWRFAEDDEGAVGYLLTAAVPGRAVRAMRKKHPRRAARLLARATRDVHDALAIEGCPFTLTPSWLLAHSESLLAEGVVDAEYCEEVTRMRPHEAIEVARRMLPPDGADLVVLHGDAYARNLVVDDATGSYAWVDWGWAGVGHRWHDLATAITWIERHCGRKHVATFLDEYGAAMDEAALTFFRMLHGLR